VSPLCALDAAGTLSFGQCVVGIDVAFEARHEPGLAAGGVGRWIFA